MYSCFDPTLSLCIDPPTISEIIESGIFEWKLKMITASRREDVDLANQDIVDNDVHFEVVKVC